MQILTRNIDQIDIDSEKQGRAIHSANRTRIEQPRNKHGHSRQNMRTTYNAAEFDKLFSNKWK